MRSELYLYAAGDAWGLLCGPGDVGVPGDVAGDCRPSGAGATPPSGVVGWGWGLAQGPAASCMHLYTHTHYVKTFL